MYASNTHIPQTPNSSVTYPDRMNVKIKILQVMHDFHCHHDH